MPIEKTRKCFSEYLTSHGIHDMVVLESCSTVDMEPTLKYERIDKFRILFLDQKEITTLMRFCDKHHIAVWLAADKLCVGYKHRGNQRLSAYYSVQVPPAAGEILEDRNISVAPEISCRPALEDRNGVRA